MSGRGGNLAGIRGRDLGVAVWREESLQSLGV